MKNCEAEKEGGGRKNIKWRGIEVRGGVKKKFQEKTPGKKVQKERRCNLGKRDSNNVEKREGAILYENGGVGKGRGVRGGEKRNWKRSLTKRKRKR